MEAPKKKKKRFVVTVKASILQNLIKESFGAQAVHDCFGYDLSCHLRYRHYFK